MNSAQQFFAWLEKTDPRAMAAVETHAPNLLAGMGHRTAFEPEYAALQGMGGETYDFHSLRGMGETWGSTTMPYDPVFSPWDEPAAGLPSDVTPSSDWGRMLSDILQTVSTTYQAKQLFDLNIARAERGLPPIDASVLSPRVNVGLSRDVQNIIIYGGLALLAIYLAKQLKVI